MASFGIVNANAPETYQPSESSDRPKKIIFGVFFDGTGNNMIQQRTAEKFKEKQKGKKNLEAEINDSLSEYGASKLEKKAPKDGSDYSNVAILHSVFQGMSSEQFEQERKSYDIFRYNIYIEGAGTEEIYKDSLVQDAKNALGSGFGNGETGVVALVSKAVLLVRTRLSFFVNKLDRTEIHFYVFGFSRGSACARLFSYLVVRGSSDALGCESKFKKFSAKQFCDEKTGFLHFLDELTAKSIAVDFLGIFDTVSSIGVTYVNNVTDYGQFSPCEDKVLHTFHICAMDEFRSHFAVTDIGKAAERKNNAELFIPGCHSDVGGGYPKGEESFVLSYPLTLYVKNPQNRNSGEKDTLTGSAEVLKKLGWYVPGAYKNKLKDHNIRKFVEVTRYVRSGYNMIPLRMMAIRANKYTQFDVFAYESIGQPRFKVPDKLSSLATQFEKEATMASGKKCIFPEGLNYNYKTLRTDFLHFSSTDELFSSHSSAVHGYSTDGNTMCRILYHGNKDDNSPLYFCDYE